jgi:hypothetical protein
MKDYKKATEEIAKFKINEALLSEKNKNLNLKNEENSAAILDLKSIV